MVDLETISELKIGVASIKRDAQSAKETKEEIERILEDIKSQKEIIDVILKDVNRAKAKEKAREEKEIQKKLHHLSAMGHQD